MWSHSSMILLATICVVLGTIVLSYQKYLLCEFEKRTSNFIDNNKDFKLSIDEITGPIVVPFKTKGSKGFLLPSCQQPLHHGVQNCTNTSSLQFYMDADTETCLAFKYSGCGGNSNNFESWEGCTRCFAMDYSGCPVGSVSINNLNSNSSICASHLNEDCTGPNAYCKRGAFFGQCCDKTIRDKDNSDSSDKTGCGPGSKKVSVKTSSGYSITLLGKTCGSNFCPQKSTCHQGNYFAYCCAVV